MKNIGNTETPFEINLRDSAHNTENSIISDETYNTVYALMMKNYVSINQLFLFKENVHN